MNETSEMSDPASFLMPMKSTKIQPPLSLPPVDKDSLPITCHAIWSYVMRGLRSSTTPIEARSDDGEAGYIFHGSLAGIIGMLWPDSAGAGRHGAEAVHVRTAANVYLRSTHNMRCLDPGYTSRWKTEGAKKNRLPVWWVRETWCDVPPAPRTTGLTRRERGLTRAEAGEDRAHAPVSVRKISPYPCLDGCGRSFADLRGQSYHARYHITHRRLIAQAAQLLRQNGGDAVALRLAEVAEGIVHASSLHRHFESKEVLVQEALAYTASLEEYDEVLIDEQQTPTVDPTAVAVIAKPRLSEFRATLLEAISYMHYLGIPMTMSGVMMISGSTKRPQRSGALAQLLGSGDVLEVEGRDYRNRPYRMYVPRIPWSPPVALSEMTPAMAEPMDPRVAIEQLMAEYDRMSAEVSRLSAQVDDGRQAAEELDTARMTDQVRMEELQTELNAANARFAKVKELFA